MLVGLDTHLGRTVINVSRLICVRDIDLDENEDVTQMEMFPRDFKARSVIEIAGGGHTIEFFTQATVREIFAALENFKTSKHMPYEF